METELVLGAGTRHEFKFVVDGAWVTSPDFPTVPNGLGGANNLLSL